MAAEGFLLLTLPNATLTSTHARETGTLCVECVTLQQVEVAVAQASGSATNDKHEQASTSIADLDLKPTTSVTANATLLDESTSTTADGITGRDVCLVLRVNSFELPILPSQLVLHSRHTHKFILPHALDPVESGDLEGSPEYPRTIPSASPSDIVIVFPTPNTETERADLESLEVILGQYAILQEVGDTTSDGYRYDHAELDFINDHSDQRSIITLPEYTPCSPTDLNDQNFRGRLVLIDEDNGRVVGTLGDGFRMREDDSVRESGREKEPVVVDLSDLEGGEKREIWVHTIPPDQQDWIMKGASTISRNILVATDKLASRLTNASTSYVSRTIPNEKPVVFSARTKTGFRRVHMVSGKAVKVSAKTTGAIHNVIVKAVGYVANGGNGNDAGDKESNAREDLEKLARSRMNSNPNPLPPAYLDVQVPYRTYSPSSSMKRGYRSSPPPLPPRHSSYTNEKIASSPVLPAPQPIRRMTGPPPPLPPRQFNEKEKSISSPSSPVPIPGPMLPPRPLSSASKSPYLPSYSPLIPVAGPSSPSQPQPQPKPKLLTRLLLSTDMLLTTLESSASTLASTSLTSLSTALGHKYGKDAGEASQLVGEAVRNVGVVYVDVKGVGRRALIKSVGKGYFKAKVRKREEQGREREAVVVGVVPAAEPSYAPATSSSGVYGMPATYGSGVKESKA